MKQEQLRACQPLQFERFVHILEQGQLNHAYLFSGNFGSLEMALFLSKSLFCSEKTGIFPCEKCRNCKLIEQEEFPDVTIIKPLNQVIKTERIRELVGQFSQSGIENQRQVFIIEQAEKMHVNAANSLLKVIEEPQSEIYIFFLTDDEEQMLPTITRLEHYYFDGDWRQDYQAYEQGEIPEEMPCGVLTEDAIFDVSVTQRSLAISYLKLVAQILDTPK